MSSTLLINDKFPNALLASGIIAQKENDYSAAFDFTIKTIRLSKPQDLLYQNALQQAFVLSKHIMATGVGKDIIIFFSNATKTFTLPSFKEMNNIVSLQHLVFR